MKKIFIEDLISSKDANQQDVLLLGWIKNKRSHKNIIFLDICDSSGVIQAVVSRGRVSDETFTLALNLKVESSVSINGSMTKTNKSNFKPEIEVDEICLVGDVLFDISPHSRVDFDIFDESLVDNLLRYRHLYIRNPKVMAMLKFRNLLKDVMREWFDSNNFVELDAPILVPASLYEGSTAIGVEIRNENVFLSQCAGFYLEAAVHAFEKVYNMGPSFRGEESRSKRHLIEYWHIKAELAWGNREDIINEVEEIFVFITNKLQERAAPILKSLGKDLCLDGLKVPFPRINYRDAIEMLRADGVDINFGVSLGSTEESILSKRYDSPFWIVGIPRSIEPFPYCIDPDDKEVTMVADLIANNGYGELLGVAEKIYDPEMLNTRMSEKQKENDPNYGFVKDVHNIGCVPHIAFGMGLERLMRWLLSVSHVRDCIPFPRVVGRKINP